MSALLAHIVTWTISAASVCGVIIRPRNWPEAWWAGSGALLLVCLSLISPAHALVAVEKGTDVYLFLIGMMLLAELARREGCLIGLRPLRSITPAGQVNGSFSWCISSERL